MLTIRLQRVGKKKYATYRLIISEKARDTHGKYLELLGSFNPHAKEGGLVVKADRIKYWLGTGAQMSNTVHNLFLTNNLIADKKKKKSVFISKKRAEKIKTKKQAAEPKVEPKKETEPKVESKVE
jgi:small subunit ribosomal protein S16